MLNVIIPNTTRNTNKLSRLLFFAIILIIFSDTSYASCTCKEETLKDAIIASDVIFEGKAVEPRFYGNMEEWQFAVKRYWKGDVGHSIGISTIIPTKNNCGQIFRNERKYLVFAKVDDQGRLIDTSCSYTKPSSQAKSTLAKLGPAETLPLLPRIDLAATEEPSTIKDFIKHYFYPDENAKSVLTKYLRPLLFIFLILLAITLVVLIFRVFMLSVWQMLKGGD